MNQNEAKMNVDQYDYESIFYSKDMMCKCGKTESEMSLSVLSPSNKTDVRIYCDETAFGEGQMELVFPIPSRL